MRKIKAAHTGTGMHRKRFGQLNPGIVLGIEQLEQVFLSQCDRGRRDNLQPAGYRDIFRGLDRRETAVRRARIPMQSALVGADIRQTLQPIDLPALWS